MHITQNVEVVHVQVETLEALGLCTSWLFEQSLVIMQFSHEVSSF